MTYIEQHNLASDGLFRARLAFAMLAYARSVVAETAPDPVTPLYEARLLQATKTNRGARMWADTFADAAASALGALGVTEPTDAHLDALVAQWWNALALAPVVP